MDRYHKKLQHAGWTWRENHDWNQGKLTKDRVYGRNDKRSAKQQDRKEIEADTELPRRPPCPVCGFEECDGPRDLSIEEIKSQRGDGS